MNYLFKPGGIFQPIDIPGLDVVGDWKTILKDAGFNFSNDFGTDHYIIATLMTGPPEFPFLLDVWNASEGLGCFVCADIPSVLEFLRDWIAPLIAMARDTNICEMLDQIDSTLFDSELGLEIVKNIRRREYEDRRKNREASRRIQAKQTE